MTDPGTADRTYIGPMSPELVEEIIEKVSAMQLSSCRFECQRMLTTKGLTVVALVNTATVIEVADCRSGQMPSCQQWVGKPR